MDPAHVNISHHGTQGKREHAQPLEMEVIESSVHRIDGRFWETRTPNQPSSVLGLAVWQLRSRWEKHRERLVFFQNETLIEEKLYGQKN